MAERQPDRVDSAQLREPATDDRADRSEGADAEHFAEDAHDLYQSLVDNLPVYVLRKNGKGRITFVNDKFAQLLGMAVDEILGKTDYDLFPRELAEKYSADDRRVMETGQLFVDVEENRAADRLYYFEVRKAPVRDPRGKIVGIQAVFWDATEQKLAEDALEYERFLLHSLMDNLPDSIYFKDAESRFVRVSEDMARRFGVSDPQEMIGKSDADFFGAEHSRDALRDEQQVMRTGQPILGKVEKEIWADGSETWVSTTKLPLRDQQGRIVGTFGVSRDITDLKLAERALARERDMLRTLMDNLPDFIYVKDAEGRYVVVNEAVRRVLRANSTEELVGRSHVEFLPPKQALTSEDADDQHVLRTGKALIDREERVVDQDGNELWLLTSKVPLSDDDGNLVGLVGIDRNITRLKRTEEQLRSAKDLADAANRAKSDFLANMSHEIRTPMNAIIGMTDLLLDTPLTATQREYLKMVQESGDALLTLINDILDFSKIEAGKLELDPCDFDLRESLGDTMKSLAIRAHDRSLELAFHVESNVPQAVRGDLGRLRQIVVNLVGNAIKFTEEGEVVLEVGCDAEDDEHVVLRFTAQDTGIGIPPEKCETIFNEFQQADSSTTRRFGGTGLGLAISKRLVEMMDGKLWMTSEVGRGSTFSFTARLARSHADPHQFVSIPNIVVSDTSILIVDDNATNRRILNDMLTNWGMRPATAASAREAMQILREAAARGDLFPVMISDLNMPEIDGYMLAMQLKSDPGFEAPAIIMLTSGISDDHHDRGRQLGIATHLMKPIKQSELFDAIVNALDLVVPAQATDARSDGAARSPSQLKILLAEDNLVNQKLAVSALQSLGHEVTLAVNGQEAVQKIQAERFDLVLMDIQMPEMDGLDATRVIRGREQQTGRRVPIVAMTAHAMKGDREMCLEAGMDDYISKPVRVNELAEKLSAFQPAEVPGVDHTPPPEEEIEAAVLPAVDWNLALAAVNGNEGLLRDVVGAFVEDAPRLLAAAQEAISAGDMIQLRRTAHSLKGSLLFLHVAPQIAAAQALENAAADGEGERAGTLLDVVSRQTHCLLNLLKAYLSANQVPGE